ncbi:hypothetical protein [Arthrobacter sp. efr-133-TYG-118]|uniref:hypothetical protein n=1 Tax=Arthrobacter sp. efr-133-TYG-118 TaxID=3040279 RepID=UPI00254AB65C|nr:hypothetical protein [Arthrobacter sp. efr-133-TYG-118]
MAHRKADARDGEWKIVREAEQDWYAGGQNVEQADAPWPLGGFSAQPGRSTPASPTILLITVPPLQNLMG